MPVAVINGRCVLFVHIPKTGGSSVERFLSGNGPLLLKGHGRPAGLRCSAQHLHAAALGAIQGAKEYDWAFTIVRHPVARLVSEYRYEMRKPGWLRSRLSFWNWLALALARQAVDPWYRDNHFRAQHAFILPGMEIMRFEDGVDACLRRVAERLGVPPPTTSIREKVSPHTPITLTAPVLARIGQAYERDLEQFGYGMDEASLLDAGIKPDMLGHRPS